MATISVKRGEAAKALDAIATAVHHWHNSKGTPDDAGRFAASVARAIRDAGIDQQSFKACEGEAHSNPHIDNCGQCAPRWGVVGPEIKVT